MFGDVKKAWLKAKSDPEFPNKRSEQFVLLKKKPELRGIKPETLKTYISRLRTHGDDNQ